MVSFRTPLPLQVAYIFASDLILNTIQQKQRKTKSFYLQNNKTGVQFNYGTRNKIEILKRKRFKSYQHSS